MKKTNNKYRNNNSNQVYSLNYKFDSISIAGKISGTALDLIKKYNELAKEAHANGDIVTAEVFRQYAEHYRKIVTEINEKKNAQKVVNFPKVNDNTNNVENMASEATEADIDLDISAQEGDMNIVHDIIAAELATPVSETTSEKKEFKVIEITDDKSLEQVSPKPKLRRHSRKKENENNNELKSEDLAV